MSLALDRAALDKLLVDAAAAAASAP